MNKLEAFIAQEALPRAYRQTIERVHRPLAQIIAETRRAHARSCLIGLSGPQGSGKSTSVAVLQLLLEEAGLKVASLSLDDFYLTRAERGRLAADVSPLLLTRGPPGTHDVQLCASTIGRLLAGESVSAPRFEKARDDRSPPTDWPLIEGPVDVVLFEGWCVGAAPVDRDLLADPVNALERDEDESGAWRLYVNEKLKVYQPLFAALDLLIMLAPPSFDVVASWRKEQEAKLRANSPDAPGVMSEAQIDRFVAHYERITRQMIADLPERALVVVRLDKERRLQTLYDRRCS